MSGDGIVTQVIQRWSDTTISTHYDGCWEWHPHCAIAILADEIERLRAEVLHEQHQVGTDPARLRTEVGAADALANTLRALVAEQHDEIERLRAAGDALAEVADEWPELVEAWQEARRER